jgi:hypothetical protein
VSYRCRHAPARTQLYPRTYTCAHLHVITTRRTLAIVRLGGAIRSGIRVKYKVMLVGDTVRCAYEYDIRRECAHTFAHIHARPMHAPRLLTCECTVRYEMRRVERDAAVRQHMRGSERTGHILRVCEACPYPTPHIVQFGARHLATNAPMIFASTTDTNDHVTVYTKSNNSYVMFLCAPRMRARRVRKSAAGHYCGVIVGNQVGQLLSMNHA